MIVYTANDVLFVNIKQLIGLSHSLKSLKDNSRDVESLNVMLTALVQLTIELTSKHKNKGGGKGLCSVIISPDSISKKY